MIIHNSVEAKDPAPAVALVWFGSASRASAKQYRLSNDWHPTFPHRHARGSGHPERWIWGLQPWASAYAGATKKDAGPSVWLFHDARTEGHEPH